VPEKHLIPGRTGARFRIDDSELPSHDLGSIANCSSAASLTPPPMPEAADVKACRRERLARA
jgi:hypothetical protein